MILSDSDINDLVIGAQKDLGRNKFQDISQELPDYVVMSKWLKKDKIQFRGGTGVQRNLKVKSGNTARNVGLYQVDDINIISLMKQMSIPWRHTRNHWGYDTVEVAMNSGDPELEIIDMVESRRYDCMLGLTEMLETNGWSSPAVDDEKSPMGLPYWIVKNASLGFNGGAPSGHTLVGNINPTTYPKWKNYTGTYSNVTKDDLISKLRTAYRQIGFKSPVDIKDYVEGRGQRYQLYMAEATLNALERLGEQQNDNLGNDLASKDDMITFKKHPCMWIPILDADSDLPIYMVDHATFYPVVLQGHYLRETKPISMGAKQHTAYVVWIDISYNFMCVNRRANAVLYKA